MRGCSLLMCVLGMLIGGTALGQFSPADTSRAGELLLIANDWRDSTAYDSAEMYYDLARALYRKSEVWPAYASVTNEMGVNYRRWGKYSEAEARYLDVLETSRVYLDSLHPEIAQAYNNMGTNYMEMGSYDQAATHLEEALRRKQKVYGNSHEDVGLTHNNLGHLYAEIGKPKIALDHLLKALEIFIEKYGEEHPDVAGVYNNLGTTYYATGDYELARNYIDKSVEIKQRILPPGDPDLLIGFNNTGFCHNLMGDYDKALEDYRMALSISIESLGAMHPQTGILYNNLGNTHRLRKDHGEALHYFQQSLEIKLAAQGPRHRDVGITYNNMGQCYDLMEDWETALTYYEKAIEIYEEALGPMSPDLAVLHFNKALVLEELKEHEAAMQGYQRAITINKASYGLVHPRIATIYSGMGESFFRKENWPEAIAYHQRAVDMRLELLGARHPDLAQSYHDLSRGYEEANDLGNALAYNTKGLKSLSREKDRQVLPGSDQLLSRVQINPILIDLLRHRAELVQHTSVEDGDKEDAMRYYRLAAQVIDSLRFSYRAASSRQTLAGKVLPVYEGAIATAYDLFEATRNTTHLEEIFFFAEKSKNLLILEALQDAKAKQFAFIPDSLLAQEQSLRVDLAYYEQKINTASLAAADSVMKSLAYRRHFELLQEYRGLMTKLESDYPEYFQLKYQTDPPEIEAVRRNILEPGQGLLEYFVGDRYLYVLLLTKETLQVRRVEYDIPLEVAVVSFRKTLYGYFLTENAGEEVFQESGAAYASQALSLYELLFPNMGIALPERLIIVPDGVLGYLPFETLLTAAPADPLAFKSHAYLLHQHQLSYGYSAALLREMQSRGAGKSVRLLAFAPDFSVTDGAPIAGRGGQDFAEPEAADAQRGDLGPLFFNAAEAKAITQLFAGTGYYGQAASRTQFLKTAPDYNVLHIATHGKTNDRESDFSFLAFSPEVDSGEQSLLYVRDLYALELQADLVVLSACETGLGRLYRGEGIASLSRGFAYAGAASIITTLWGVNDQRTATFMESLYGQLKLSLPKDEALRISKQQHLDQSDNYYAHPFFWAGYVAIGDMKPLQTSQSMGIWMAVGFLLLIATGASWLLFKRFQPVASKES